MSAAWFTKKEYGYGWAPCSWQGVLVIVAYMALQGGAAIYVATTANPRIVLVGIWIATWSLVLFAVCRAHTASEEKPVTSLR